MCKIIKNILLVTISIYILLSCAEDRNIERDDTDSVTVEIQPDQISWNVEVFFIDSSFTKAILQAKRSRIFQKQQETFLDSGMQVEFMSRETETRVSILTSDSGRIDDRTKDMLAGGNVVVISDSTQTRLETNLLEWNHETQKLYSTEFVRIISPYETIQGYGFESDQNLDNYKIFKVSGEQRQVINDNKQNK